MTKPGPLLALKPAIELAKHSFSLIEIVKLMNVLMITYNLKTKLQ